MIQVVWKTLNELEKKKLLIRPALKHDKNITQSVYNILLQVREKGDYALKELTKKLDHVDLESIRVPFSSINAAKKQLSDSIKPIFQKAYQNITAFHQAQKLPTIKVETQPGVVCEQITRAIEKVGLYIPGGKAPLVSTVLMLGIPAYIAGCHQVVLCSPPPISDEILYVAQLCGIDDVYSIGGAQAIAAMAYGTQTVPKVDKIFGPGNAYVTEAKKQVSQEDFGASIDMPAGPSEVLVIADDTANPSFIAADLLSQAEHGSDSQVVLVTPSLHVANQVSKELENQLVNLDRVSLINKSLESSLIIIVESINQAIEVSNSYAPEHLIIQTENARNLLPLVKHAGSIFLGHWSPESVGDYASGTNHVLPTYGYVKTYSSLGLSDFSKRMTVQELSKQGLIDMAPTVISMAECEGLKAHKEAVTVRLNQLKKGSRE